MKGQVVFFVFFIEANTLFPAAMIDLNDERKFSRQLSESNQLFEFVQQQNKKEIQLVFKCISDFLQEEELESKFINGNIWF